MPVELDVALRPACQSLSRPPRTTSSRRRNECREARCRGDGARVRVGRRDGVAELEIADDGAGGADPALGSGLRGLRDRVEALGGRFALTSPTGLGTTIRVEIPCA